MSAVEGMFVAASTSLRFLSRKPLAVSTAARRLAIAMSRGADFAEVYAERTERTLASLEDGKIKSASFGVDQEKIRRRRRQGRLLVLG